MFISNVLLRTPTNCLTPHARYEKLADIYGGRGYFCESLDELKFAITEANKVKPTKFSQCLKQPASKWRYK